MKRSKTSVSFSVDYPKRELNRTTTFFRLIVAIPICILLASISGTSSLGNEARNSVSVSAGGLLFIGPMLMILFRQKYPKWWFDWNLEFMRFSARVATYMALMDDRYPSTDEQQSVHLDIEYPNVLKDLNRWLPLVKWFLAIPHYFVLLVLNIAAVFAVIYTWFAILFTGRYPRAIFDFIVKVVRWNLRVTTYAFVLTTDNYPPFSLNAR